MQASHVFIPNTNIDRTFLETANVNVDTCIIYLCDILSSMIYRFLCVDIGCNGRVSDGGVFNGCIFHTSLERGTLNLPDPNTPKGFNKDMPFSLVADDAFPLCR